MVKVAASGFYRWGKESNFGEAPNNVDLYYGLNAKITKKMMNNPKSLRDTGVRPVRSFAYGQLGTEASIDTVLSNPYILNLIFDKNEQDNVETGTGANGIVTNVWTDAEEPPTATIETQFDAEDGAFRYRYEGSVIQSASLNSSIGEYVGFKFDFKGGKASITTVGSYSKGAIPLNNPDFPFTFRHGAITQGGTEVQELESFNLDIKTGSDIQYDHGTVEGKSAYAGSLDITGSLKFAVKNDIPLKKVKNPQSYPNETLVIKFANKTTVGAGYSEITLTMPQIIYSEITNEFSENDRVFYDTSFIAKQCTVTVKNQYRNPITKLTSGNTLLSATNITRAAAGSQQVTLTLPSAGGGNGWRVYSGTSPSPITPQGTDFTGTSRTVSGLTSGVKYYFRAVKVKNGVVISRPSVDVTAVPT